MNPTQDQPLGDLDYSLDQSTRVERRVAHGLYSLSHGGQDVGEEVWAIFALRNGAFRCLTEVEQKWPVLHQQRAQLDVDDQWKELALWAQVDLHHTRRMATYIPSAKGVSIEIAEAHLHEEEERPSRTAQQRLLASRIAAGELPGSPRGAGALVRSPSMPYNLGQNGHVIKRNELPFNANSHLDFASALFNFVVLQRLNLRRGSHATFDSVVLTLPSLEPLCVKQTYAYEQDETIARGSTRLPAQRYHITEVGSPELVTTFWTDAHGIVLRQELMLEGSPYQCEMVNYRWLG